jgi:CheY-like chemotaxis protein/anti-sigma regulatory factor (Ser/Thr protein kinase)
MRTPLNAIIGFSELELYKDTAAISEETLSAFEKIYTSGVSLLGIINDILDISKIESGKFNLAPVTYDVSSMINDAVALNVVRIGSRPIEFILNIDENVPGKLWGDDLRVKQILNNLLSNAIKYTEKGSVELAITSERDDDAVWLICTVTDTGIGIPKDKLPELFHDYSQIGTNQNRKIESTGLGLAIAKRLAEFLNGTISVESEYGKGSVFTVRLKQQFVCNVPISKEVIESLKQLRYAVRKRNNTNKLLRLQIPYANVLVVDDVQSNLDIMRGMLKPYGLKVDCVNSGYKAIELVREAKVRYNAIFLDHMMPELDGVETAHVIRNEIGTEYAKNVPIIMLTANALIGNEEMFLKQGFQAFLSKPIDVTRLYAVINTWVRDKKLEERLGLTVAESAREDAASEKEIPAVSINGVDLQQAMSQFGTFDTYIEALDSYRVNTPPLLETLHNPNAETLVDFAITVHGIKGASYGICAAQIGKDAEALENAARAGELDFACGQVEPFILSTTQFIAEISGFLDSIKSRDVKPLKHAPDKALLEAMRTASERYDLDTMDTIIEELERFSYKEDGALVQWIREQINMSEFDKIHERLS